MVDRRLLWAAMSSLHLNIGAFSWIQMGDFNVVLRRSERIGEFDLPAASEFRQCLLATNMEEMITRGFWFTWTNCRGGGGTNMSRIDRVLVNNSWLDVFPDTEALAHAPGISDHCSLLVTVLKEVAYRRPFRFFNFWMKHHQFKVLVRTSWDAPLNGSAMFRLTMKLKRLKPVLRELNKKCFSNISHRVVEARQHMDALQLLCAQNAGDDNIRAQEKEAVRLYMELSAAEESFKKQKSRVNWLALGDQNTKFFHHKVSCNRMRNKIFSLVNAEGSRLDRPEEVRQEIIEFYTNLLGTKFLHRRDAKGCLLQIIKRKVPSTMHSALIRPFNIENGDFKYHPRCQALDLSHVIFADDLFVLSSAHEGSLQVVLNTLGEFHSFSGLQPNMTKSAVFFSGVSSAHKQSLVALLGMLEGFAALRG
ncbi:hypothetical protein Vadar_012922 [Vaccinium darrowii]|uniref:Uncharacterized protein n=1 Tax=Vaccinium darrowii TaxID=229202 RepID=A0ACB7ZBV4_9ERIC|nr:hypothetical protein Vadar_012922 [Vaccinium darrowii]